MSTIVCQNLVSCFESQLTKTTTNLKLKPPPQPSHPLAENSSFSRLSAKSLELCTESLGSETGTDNIAIFVSSPSIYPSNSENPPLAELEKSKREFEAAGYNEEADPRWKLNKFPPPLSTMSGQSSLLVRHHREAGRLIIEAVEKPLKISCLQAERSDGRLRLCLLAFSDAAATTSTEEVENGDECATREMAEIEEIDEPRSEFETEIDKFDGELNLEIGIEEFQRLRRCKEKGYGNRGFISHWKPAHWVATS